ncbi:hypothetical protein [Geodermatophilus sp. URMC 64]
MQTVVPEARIDRAHVARVGIGRLELGPLSVGELIAGDVRMGIRSGRAELRGVRVTVQLRFSLLWSIRVPLPWPFDDIVITEQESSLGRMDLPFAFGDADIPSLQDIDLRIPRLSAAGVVTQADPVTGVELTDVQAEGVQLVDLTLPSAGFTFAGLALTAVNVNDVAVPAAGVRTVAVRQVRGAPARLPALRLRGLDLPAASAGDVGSGPIDLTVNRSQPLDTVPVPLGVLTAALRVRAGARTQVAQMRLSGVQAGASAGTVELRDVTVPFSAGQLTLADLGLDTLEIPLLGVA